MASGKIKLCLNWNGTGAAPPIPNLNFINLDQLSIRIDAVAGTVIGNLTGFTAGSSKAISPNSHIVEITGSDAAGWKLVVGVTGLSLGTLDFAIVETKAGYGNSPNTTNMGINVTDLPQAGTLYLGKLTPNGYGEAFGESYAGTGYLRVENATGNGMIKLRYNKFNKLVFANDGTNLVGSTGGIVNAVTATPITPTSIADTYTFDAVEYSDANYTIPTGNSASRVLHTSGIYTVPAQVVAVGSASFATIPAHDIDIAKARFVTEWPLFGNPRVVTGDTLTVSNTGNLGALNNQIHIIQTTLAGKLLGQQLILCPSKFNDPYVDPAFPAGTTDYTTLCPMTVGNLAVNTLAAFGGTPANDYEDANWYTVTMIDPANTSYGYHSWTASGLGFVRFTGCFFKQTRASLVRGTNTGNTVGGQSQGLMHIAGAPQYCMIDHCVFDFDTTPALVGGGQTTRIANGIYNKGPTTALNWFILKYNVIGAAAYVFNITGGPNVNGATPGLVGTNYIQRFNANTGDHDADVNVLGVLTYIDSTDNLFVARRLHTPVHADFWQFSTKAPPNGSQPGSYHLGYIARNRYLSGVDDNPANSQGILFTLKGTGTSATDFFYGSGTIEHNLYVNAQTAGISLNSSSGILIQKNICINDPTILQEWNGTIWTNDGSPGIKAISGRVTNCTFQHNISMATSNTPPNSDGGGPSGVGAGLSDGHVVFHNLGGVGSVTPHGDTPLINVSAVFNAPVFGQALADMSWEEVLVAFKTKPAYDGYGICKSDGTLT